MGEFRVHRVRFCEYTPNAIHCLAYDESGQKLAVSRSDGSVEVWNLKYNWLQEKVLAPPEGGSVEALLWRRGQLFSAGLDGNINEYDLVTGNIKRKISSNNGPIWCLALKEDGSQLAAGTEDGCVVVYDILSDGLEFSRSLSRQEGRILCVAYHSAENVIVTGGVDNIRVWSLSSGHAIQRLTLARVDKNKETIVWTIAVTKDFTVVSGDSSGKTSFWNGRQGTLIKSFKSHRADVLCLCVNKDGTSVFSSGVDPSLTQFEFVSTNENSDWKMWVRSTVRLQHTHDVRAVTFTDSSIVSGGVDTQLIVNHIEGTSEVRSDVSTWKRIPPIPQAPIVYTAKTTSTDLVMFRYPEYLELWTLGTTGSRSDKSGEILPLTSNPVKVLQLKFREGEFVTCAAISHDAQWIVYSDQKRLRLFHTEITENDIGSISVNVTRVRCLPPDVRPAHNVVFTRDGSRLISTTDSGQIQVIRPDSIQPEFLHPIGSHNTERSAVHVLSVCPQGKYVATGDLQGNVHVYNVNKAKHVGSVPDLSQLPTALTFHPTLPILLVAYTNQMIVEYNIVESSFTEWSRKHMYRFPHAWQKSLHKVRHVMYNRRNSDHIIFSDDTHFTIIDKTQRFPDKDVKVFKENKVSSSAAFHTCAKFKYVVHLDLLDEDFMLVVERPHLAMMETLPDALKIKKFGT